jgi:hypothetical protein
MTRHQKFVEWAKVPLLVAILVFAVWNVSTYPPSVDAQLAASSGFSYSNITGAANTLSKSSGGTLHNIVINGGTLTGTITVVDTSAANCTGGTAIGIIAANQVAGQNYEYDLQFLNGLCITSAAAVNATVTWR